MPQTQDQTQDQTQTQTQTQDQTQAQPQTQPQTQTDRIEKKILLRATRSRVFRALTDAEEFGKWFRVQLTGPLVEGATVRGQLTQPGYEHLTLELRVERIESERRFVYSWHPYAVDPKIDYSAEPMTQVEFTLHESTGGTLLTIVESGFDKLPLGRRAQAFRMNDHGWAAQAGNLEQYVCPQ